MVAPTLRLREGPPALMALPWDRPLAAWDPTEVALRDVPVGPSRHLVRFVEAGGGLFAVKEMPTRVVRHEWEVLRTLRRRRLPAVVPVGVVERGPEENGYLVTRYLDRSWQYRRLFARLPREETRHRERLLDAMASLVVDLHRAGVWWGDCSLSNTLFVRDGQALAAYLVDAETAEVHPRLTDGQRRHDLDILVENVAGGLVDVAERLGEDPDDDWVFGSVDRVLATYEGLWHELYQEVLLEPGDDVGLTRHLRRLNDLGFAVEEVSVEPTSRGGGDERVTVKVAVADRRWHAEQLRARTGVDVGEGQAQVLLSDLTAFEARLQASGATPGPLKDVAARRWVREVLEPGLETVAEALPDLDPVQAFCDVLEVKWLLSERAGDDVGVPAALAVLAGRQAPSGSSAQLLVVDDAETTTADDGPAGDDDDEAAPARDDPGPTGPTAVSSATSR